MSRTGSGTSWDDPKLYDNWTDFYAAMCVQTGYNYIGLTDPHLTMDNVFTGEGDGTKNNPYVVSTYREMLTVTGASAIWRCRLSDEDADLTDLTQPRHYWYNNGVRTIWCLFDPTPTTIDFNEIYPSGTDTRFTYRKGCDFNGWTFLNLFSTGTANTGIFYGRSTDDAFRNMILANCRWIPSTSSYNYAYMLNVYIQDSILQIDTDNSYSLVGFTYSTSYGSGFVRNSLYWRVRGSRAFTTDTMSGVVSITDSIVELDVVVTGNATGTGSTYNGLQLIRSLVKGSINCNGSDNSNIFNGVADSIIDLSINTANLGRPIGTCTHSVYNNQKAPHWSNITGLTGVTTEQLLSPTALQEAGLSIGVDT